MAGGGQTGAVTTTDSCRALLPAPWSRPPLDAHEAARLAALLKALGDPTRLRLLSLIAAHDGGEACVCDLTDPVGLAQPTVSHHLRVLLEAGLVTRERRGAWSFYRTVPEQLQAVADALSPGTAALLP